MARREENEWLQEEAEKTKLESVSGTTLITPVLTVYRISR